MPKKNYNVLITAYSTVLVIGAESKDKAFEYAQNEVSRGDFEIDECRIEEEVKKSELEQARRLANVVAEDES